MLVSVTLGLLSVPALAVISSDDRMLCPPVTGDSQAQNVHPTHAPYKPVIAPGDGFSFTMTAVGIALPADFERQIEVSARQIYNLWRDLLAEQQLRPVQVQLLLLADPIDFDNSKQRLAPDLPVVSGFYSGRTNQAIVRYDARQLQDSQRTAVHEISHLITSSQLGPADLWLAEGLAEYLETLQISGDKGIVAVNTRHLRWLKGAQLPVLAEFINLPAADWDHANIHRNYAVAWSVIYFLMNSEQGRQTLEALLRHAAAHRCQSYSTAALLDTVYIGGLQQLDADWRVWLESPALSQHEYGARRGT